MARQILRGHYEPLVPEGLANNLFVANRLSMYLCVAAELGHGADSPPGSPVHSGVRGRPSSPAQVVLRGQTGARCAMCCPSSWPLLTWALPANPVLFSGAPHTLHLRRSPQVAPEVMLGFEQLSDANGERVFSRFNNGRWWEETEVRSRLTPRPARAEGHTMCSAAAAPPSSAASCEQVISGVLSSCRCRRCHAHRSRAAHLCSHT